MKNLTLIGILSLFLFYSCATTMDRPSQRVVRGTWSLDQVTYSEKMVKVKAFDDYDAQCLKNSTWYFIANNNSGNFAMNNGGNCPSLSQNFKWYVDPQGMFVLKLLYEGEKARKVTTGTTYQLNTISDSEFSLNQIINGVKISYHFTKLSDKKLN